MIISPLMSAQTSLSETVQTQDLDLNLFSPEETFADCFSLELLTGVIPAENLPQEMLSGKDLPLEESALALPSEQPVQIETPDKVSTELSETLELKPEVLSTELDRSEHFVQLLFKQMDTKNSNGIDIDKEESQENKDNILFQANIPFPIAIENIKNMENTEEIEKIQSSDNVKNILFQTPIQNEVFNKDLSKEKEDELKTNLFSAFESKLNIDLEIQDAFLSKPGLTDLKIEQITKMEMLPEMNLRTELTPTPEIMPLAEIKMPESNFSLSQAEPIKLAALSASSADWREHFIERIMWTVHNQVKNVEIEVHPKELGTINVFLSMDKQATSIHFASPSESVRSLIEESLIDLKNHFNSEYNGQLNTSVSDEKYPKNGGFVFKRDRDEEISDALLPAETLVQNISSAKRMGLVDYYA